MNRTRALARPFDDCLSRLLVFRLLLLTLVAVITTGTIVLRRPSAPDPSFLSLQAALAADQETPSCTRHSTHWYDDFPADSHKTDAEEADPGSAGVDGSGARQPAYNSELRPIRR